MGDLNNSLLVLQFRQTAALAVLMEAYLRSGGHANKLGAGRG
jgi:hypothetical protein